jgi:hypothetical protein
MFRKPLDQGSTGLPEWNHIGSDTLDFNLSSQSAMQKVPEPQLAPLPGVRWSPRDSIAAFGLFVATAAVVLWQNSHLVILWDFSYVIDSAVRISLGQLPYRDFPFSHAPLTFLIQAAIIHFTGRAFFHHVLYCAIVGGLGTVFAWRIVLDALRGRVRSAWPVSILLSAPLTVLGIYCIFPDPSYDCDCIFSILVAILLLQRLAKPRNPARAFLLPLATGAAIVLPLFFKQNIGLPFLLVTLAAFVLLVAATRVRRKLPPSPDANFPTLLLVLASAVTTLIAAGLAIHLTVGLSNYTHWTIGFAAQRRMPGFKDMMAVYAEPSLMWMLPSIAVALLLLLVPQEKAKWAKMLALALMAAPFLYTLIALFLYDDADERGDNLLALWPMLLILSAVLTLSNLRRGLSLHALLPAVVLVTIHGALLSQQLWGSTYALWPLLILLIAEMIAFLAPGKPHAAPLSVASRSLAPALAAVIAATLLICGSLYTASEERLTYVQLPEGPLLHSTFAPLAGMSTTGPYLPDFDELLSFAAANIPAEDGLILLPGEDPFYFATSRLPQFPVLLFDPATQPYTPAELVEQARTHNIRWLIVKRNLQIKEDPTPQRQATLNALLGEFNLRSRLRSYDIYRRP